jgi:hypothetical protein
MQRTKSATNSIDNLANNLIKKNSILNKINNINENVRNQKL